MLGKYKVLIIKSIHGDPPNKTDPKFIKNIIKSRLFYLKNSQFRQFLKKLKKLGRDLILFCVLTGLNERYLSLKKYLNFKDLLGLY